MHVSNGSSERDDAIVDDNEVSGEQRARSLGSCHPPWACTFKARVINAASLSKLDRWVTILGCIAMPDGSSVDCCTLNERAWWVVPACPSAGTGW